MAVSVSINNYRGEGPHIGRKRVSRLLAIQAHAKKKSKATTTPGHSQTVAKNYLDRQLTPDSPNTSWVADITYIWTKEGWLYLATIMDLYSRKIIGWLLRKRLTKELVMVALNMALKQRKLCSSLLLHSDRGGGGGSQFTSELYQKLLEKKWYTMFHERQGKLLR